MTRFILLRHGHRRRRRCTWRPAPRTHRAVLTAADMILKRHIAEITLLGDPGAISRRAAELGLNLTKATVVNPKDPELLEKFAAEYAKLRAHKGITLNAAREKLADLSYFGTMMVHLDMADGMVSGAVNTTANTIRPSLEFVKTKALITYHISVFPNE